MGMMKRIQMTMWAGVFLLISAGAEAVPIDPGLTGTTQVDGWAGLTAANYPGYPAFPGAGAWPTPIGSNQPGSGDAELAKVSGNATPLGAAIYFGGFSSTPNTPSGILRVGDTSAIANLETVVLQIVIGEAFGYDFFNGVFPALSYNGGSQNLAAGLRVLRSQVQTGTFTNPITMEEEPIFTNEYLLQWDLSSLGAITDFGIQFQGVQHAQLYELRLDQGDAYTLVPEPATALQLLAGLLGLGLVSRRR
jgi:hypothetical protein